MKFNDLEFINRKVYNSSCLVDIKSKPMHMIFESNDKKLKHILFKELYKKKPTVNFLEKMTFTNCLSTFLNLIILEDQSIINEIKEPFHLAETDSIKNIFGFDTVKYDSYQADYDKNKLILEENGNYTLNGNVCIESNNRTTHYFRDILILNDESLGGIVILNNDNLNTNDNSNHKFINCEFSNSEESATNLLADYLNTYSNYCHSYDPIYNVLLVKLLSNDDTHIKKVLEAIHNFNFSAKPIPIGYDELYLNVVEMKSISLLDPKLLFNEIMGSDNDNDIILGLSKLSFKIFN